MSNLRSLIRRAALEVPEIRRLRERLRLAEAGAAEAAAARAAEAAAARAVETASAQIAALESRRTELEAECGTVTQQLLAAERERDLLAARLAGAEPVPALMARLDERIDALAHDTRAATDTVLQSTRAATDTVLQSTQAATDTVLQSTQATTDTLTRRTQIEADRVIAGSPRPIASETPTEVYPGGSGAYLDLLEVRLTARWTRRHDFTVDHGLRSDSQHLAATGLRPRPP
jgi:chromosome segregation ATPase